MIPVTWQGLIFGMLFLGQCAYYIHKKQYGLAVWFFGLFIMTLVFKPAQ